MDASGPGSLARGMLLADPSCASSKEPSSRDADADEKNAGE